MQEPSEDVAPSPVTDDTQAQDHDQIRTLLADLEARQAPDAIGAVVAELVRILPRHFGEEEAEGGFFDQLRDKRPELDHRLQGLAADHREMSRDLTYLAEAIGEVNVALEHMAQTKSRFVQRLRAHERQESRLMLDTYMTDLGTSD